MAKKSKKLVQKTLYFVGVIICIVIIVFIFLLLKYNSSQPPINNQALVEYIPNFETLTLVDLPNFTDFRDVYDYNEHIIVVGFNRVVEYDNKNNKFIRANNPEVLGCVYDSAKIDNFLFVSCNSHFPDEKFLPETKTIIASKIYKIDLNTGKIVKQYFGNELLIDPSIDQHSASVFKTKGARSNLILGSRNNILYMGSWDGVEKMDIVSEKITLYSHPNELKPGNELSGIGLGSPGTDWFAMNPPIKPPVFKSISPLHNGKYYILASEGVHSLAEDQFPQKIINVEIEGSLNKSTFSQDGRYLVFIGKGAYGLNPEPLINDEINGYLVDFQEKTAVDLTNTTRFKKPLTPKITEIAEKLNNGYFEQEGEIIHLKDVDTNNILLSIDLANSRLDILDISE
ncbi:MAG: hypothetical protein US60_C0005G0001 [Microgenomates group bacterium GW2011_GWC1_37_8]|uniref:Uncharacterized protein n=1 Tax=Candidatus Woesebacteria bacterium GW2011_GWB1_38_8 TaxID=1618570 RepID=A0A0G0LEE4_9BACT|nr:MAG: hypothetical protein US60_C0005G0001 [Microgenomates group bacterium GW2011_GWC1_37_8]KKQ86300.1 MAG: hypothetical protein UT08_C0001G0166 [Candidatus Woesebacteria bacterium GW2011_GWB1_38_8]